MTEHSIHPPLQARNKRLVAILCTIAFLLLIPLVAMQFTSEVNWTIADFVAAAVLLLTTGLLCEIVMRKVRSRRSRLILCAVILLCLVLMWIELAVGIFGSPFAGT